ncbi:hypothetical protein TrCOL_g1718 [Triparma columacea]|uniref:RIIa domain-containing protein n=1 Tax=Triparma columacea TaxID=722753 RepID=A0A9W7L7T9_9STRA|nr:hypothetical protein TrCOL_g1718 [Triparma columacea]
MSKYAKSFEMPKDFPDLLRAFSKEVLRDSPKDVYSYAHEYFMNKLEEKAIAKETEEELAKEKAAAAMSSEAEA